MPLAILQGTITVPMFDSGIKIGALNLTLNCGVGDQPILATAPDIYLPQTQPGWFGFFSSQLNSSKQILLTLNGASTLTVGKGEAAAQDGEAHSSPGIMAGNLYVNSGMRQAGIGGIKAAIPWPCQTPFVQNTNTGPLSVGGASVHYSPPGFFLLHNGLDTNNQFSAVFNTNPSGLPGLSRLNINVAATNQLSGESIVLGNVEGIAMFASQGTGALFVQACANKWSTISSAPTTFWNPQGGLQNDDHWVIPSPETAGNFFWSKTQNSTPALIRKMVCDLDIIGNSFTLGADVTGDSLIFDDPKLNGLSISTGQYQPCADGVLFSYSLGNGSNAADYYISKDGTRYWQILYANQGAKVQNGSQIPFMHNDGIRSRWIDKNGIMWYVGNAVQATSGPDAGNTFVANSFGVNIPFQPVVLPQIPPISFPCWSPCLDRIGGNPGTLGPRTVLY